MDNFVVEYTQYYRHILKTEGNYSNTSSLPYTVNKPHSSRPYVSRIILWGVDPQHGIKYAVESQGYKQFHVDDDTS